MKPTSTSAHLGYILVSLAAAFIALFGILTDSPLLYGIIPGIIGGISAAVASVRFLKHKTDLAGFIATILGFAFYQEFQANPVTLAEFSAYLQEIPMQDKAVGLFLSNLTTAMLLISYHIMAFWLPGTARALTPSPAQTSRATIDRKVMVGFWIVFAMVALPNVLFGKVVVGAIDNILYQRMAWYNPEEYGGFAVSGGATGLSSANMALWATSLFILWIYLLHSRYRRIMLVLSPLVLIWTASVALQGSRTPLVAIAVVGTVYFFGNSKSGKKSLVYAFVAVVFLYFCLQISSVFRNSGLVSFNWQEFSAQMFEIHGNEGASSEIDGIQYFRTELLGKDQAVNPVSGLFRGLLERPLEGLLMPVPRSLFPWKPIDESSLIFNQWYVNVRIGVSREEAGLGASPGLIGRELIRYGIFGPFTLFFWMGLFLALADRLYSVGAASDFHRIFAALLAAFIAAQARDFVPLWFLPFLPAGVVLGYVARRAIKSRPARVTPAPRPRMHPVN
jgi:hypothetical protein